MSDDFESGIWDRDYPTQEQYENIDVDDDIYEDEEEYEEEFTKKNTKKNSI